MELDLSSNISFISGDSTEVLKGIKDETFQAIVTSPPYFQCRIYKEDETGLGRESTPEIYVSNLVEILKESMRCLKSDGVMWLNIGDSIAKEDFESLGIKKKESIGIPWMVAQQMRKAGFYIRQEIIWHKLNPMPNSVKDMCVPSHESIFIITKKGKYYFDVKAIEEDATTTSKPKGSSYEKFGGNKQANGDNPFYSGRSTESTGKRRKRDVWQEPTAKCKIDHAAAYPESLIVPCILASTKKDDSVLDPFSGTGTTGIVCKRLERKFVGIEKIVTYHDYATKRCKEEQE